MKKKNPVYTNKRQGWEPIHNKYKANKSPRTHVTKEHNNQKSTNTLFKKEDSKLKRSEGVIHGKQIS
jgi:hypothetical protein